jgi:hypothetical protein
MKKYLLLTIMMLFGVIAYAQTTATTHQWNETTHDFGKIPQGTPATCEFKITNKGNAALVITNTTGSCGCTVPEWSKDPIASKKTGFVKATFSAAASGPFSKTITVTLSNGVTEVLTIKGEVIAATSTPTPQTKQ